MGKRLIRIIAKDIPARIKSLSGVELNLVLADKTTLHGTVTACTNNQVEILDTMQKKHLINLAEVIEIVYDKESSF